MIRIGRQVVAGSATIDPSEYLKSNVPNSNVWIGSEAEYEELSDIVKNDTKITFITYEDESAVSWIVDNVISYSKTWSSVKISTQLANKLNASQAYTKSEVDALLNAKLSSVYKYCGKVSSASYLPSGASNGDLYFVADESVNYVWNAEDSQWDKMSSLVDLTNYITSASLESILANYAEKFQFVTIPTASATYEDKVVQFIGDTTQDFTKGSFYQCQNNSGTYSWVSLSVCRAITTLYDNTSSGLAANNVQAAIDEVVEAIPKPTVSTTSPYTKLGVQLGAVPGNVRSRSEPINTVLILGNSLTGCHLTYTVDGRSIDELREVGATHPNSGWIGLIHDYLVTIYPNIKIYKTNAAVWEQTSHATGRNYNLIKDLEVYEVTDNGSFEVPNKTVNDILPLADFVTIDLFENIQDCVGATNVSELAGDYDALLLELKAINSNAFYSLFFGFWYDKWKKAALLNTRIEWNFWGEPSFLPCWMSDNRYYCGEAMQYGIDGSEIGTIVPAAATHPNDDAYYLMACQWLNHVFNVSNKNRCPVYTPDTGAASLASHDIFNPPRQSSYDFNTDIRVTDYPTLHPIRDRYYYAMPGNYTAGLLCGITKGLGSPSISTNPAYGLLSVSYVSGSYVMDFTGAWTQAITELYGFVIRECLLYAIGDSFKPHYLGKYQVINQDDEFPINFDDFILDSMTGWITDRSERRILGVAQSTRDTGYPAEGWFELWTSSNDVNQAIQYCITTGGQRYVRNRAAGAGWSAWVAY